MRIFPTETFSSYSSSSVRKADKGEKEFRTVTNKGKRDQEREVTPGDVLELKNGSPFNLEYLSFFTEMQSQKGVQGCVG